MYRYETIDRLGFEDARVLNILYSAKLKKFDIQIDSAEIEIGKDAYDVLYDGWIQISNWVSFQLEACIEEGRPPQVYYEGNVEENFEELEFIVCQSNEGGIFELEGPAKSTHNWVKYRFIGARASAVFQIYCARKADGEEIEDCRKSD